MNHPNLSDEINNNITQSEIDGGLDLKKLNIGNTIKVQTKNTLYLIKKIKEEEYLIQDHSTYCPTFKVCQIYGSTWGGSMLKLNYLGFNMHMEFYINHKRITTTPIQSIKEI